MARGKAKYAEVRDHLEGRITKMEPGDQLPTEPVLCDEYGVSRITIRRAVDELMREGLLTRVQGRGTFVTEPKYTQQIRETFADQVTGFYRQQTLLGREGTTDVLHNRISRQPVAAQMLGMSPADELIFLERLRYVNGTLHQHVVTYLPASKYPGVLDQDFSRGSLFEYLSRAYDVQLVRNDLLVRLERVDEHVAEALRLEPGEPVLAIDTTVFVEDDVPVALGIARHTPANSEITFSLRHQSPKESLSLG